MNKFKLLTFLLLLGALNISGVGKLLADPTANPSDIPTDLSGWSPSFLNIEAGTTNGANSLNELDYHGRKSSLKLNINPGDYALPMPDTSSLTKLREPVSNVQGYGTNVDGNFQLPTVNTLEGLADVSFPLYFGGQLYIPQSFNSTPPRVDTQLWGNVLDPGTGGEFFTSVGFTNVDYNSMDPLDDATAIKPGNGSIYVYNTSRGIFDPVSDNYVLDNEARAYQKGANQPTLKYNDWNHFVVVIKFNDPNYLKSSGGGPVPALGLYYYVNGKFVDSVYGMISDVAPNGIYNLYTMAINRGVEYDSYWSELSVGQVIFPGQIAAVASGPVTLIADLSPRDVSNLYDNVDNFSGDTLILPGGVLQGSGTVKGMLHNYGTIKPGTDLDPYSNITVLKGYRGTIDDVPTIQFNVFFGNKTTSLSNKMIFSGPVLPGSDPTKIVVINKGGSGSPTGHGPGKGIMLLDFSMAGAGSSGPGDFYLDGGAINVGPYIYKLYLESDYNWYLQSDGAFTPATALYSSIPISTAGYGLALLDTLHHRNGGKINSVNGEICKDRAGGKCAWSRAIWEHGVRDVKNFYTKGPNYKYNYKILQVGKELYYNRNDNGSRDSTGLYLAAGNSDVYVKQISSNDSAGKIKFNGYTLGGYWTHYGEGEGYTDTIIQGTKLDRINANSKDNEELKTKGWSASASFEGGYPFKFKNNWLMEPQAQLIAQTTSVKTANDLSNAASFNDYFSVTGRIGSRIARTWGSSDNKDRVNEAWLRLDIIHEFDGRSRTAISPLDKSFTIPFNFNTSDTSGKVGVGFKSNFDKVMSFHAHADYQKSFKGKSWSCGGRVGLQIKL